MEAEQGEILRGVTTERRNVLVAGGTSTGKTPIWCAHRCGCGPVASLLVRSGALRPSTFSRRGGPTSRRHRHHPCRLCSWRVTSARAAGLGGRRYRPLVRRSPKPSMSSRCWQAEAGGYGSITPWITNWLDPDKAAVRGCPARARQSINTLDRRSLPSLPGGRECAGCCGDWSSIIFPNTQAG